MSQISNIETTEEDKQRKPADRLKTIAVIALACVSALFLLGLTYAPEAVKALNSPF